MSIRGLILFCRRLLAEARRLYYEETILDRLRTSARQVTIDRSVRIIRPDRLTLGDGVLIHAHCVLYCSGSAPEERSHGRIVLGNRVELGWGCILHGGGAQIVIRDDAIIGAGAVLVSEMYSYTDPTRPARQQPKIMGDILIEENATIGANAVVLPGVTIGRSAIVGAGAVVTSDVPPFSVVVGVPARVVKQRDEPHRK